MKRLRNLVTAVALFGTASYVGATGVFSAFSGTTSNPSNTFAAGTVYISDNDGGSALLALSAGKPADTTTGCIKVTYSGTLDSNVRLYGSVSGSLGTYLTLTVTRGTDSSPSFSSCTNFTADATNYIGSGAGVIYNGNLSAYPASYATGLVDPTSGSPATWSTSIAHSYKFVITLQNDNNAQGLSATASFTWEARNT